MHYKVMGWTQHVLLKPMHKVLTVTLTFDLATWFLLVTYPLVMMIICAKLFINPTMHDKSMGQHKQVSLKPMQKV